MIEIFDYDPTKYPLADWARDVLGWQDLGCIHQMQYPRATSAKQRVYYFTNRMKDSYHAQDADGARVRNIVSDFVRDEVRHRLAFEPWLTILPNFRLHEAGEEATSPMHRDRDYLTERGSLKIWMPFTDVSHGGTLYIESREGRHDLRPYSVHLGQALLFDSLNLLHGCRYNDSGRSRVSMDFIVRRDPAR